RIPVTEADRKIATAVVKRRTERPFAKFKVVAEEERVVIKHEHEIPTMGAVQWMHAAGTGDETFASTILTQLANVGREKQSADLNATAALFQGIGPKDETEAMLAAQMVAIHNATMTAARRLNRVETIEQQDSAS